MSPTLTAKGAATRERIVEAAVQLVRAQGVDQVGLDDIRAETATSKSQLFHYFPGGRSELLRAVARREAEQVLEDQQPFLDRLGPARTWRAWRNVVVRKYREQGDACPLSALTRQLSPSDPAIRVVVADLLGDWHSRLADGVRRSPHRSGGDPPLDADRTAATILAAIQGGVVIMQATGDISFLEAALDVAIVPLTLS